MLHAFRRLLLTVGLLAATAGMAAEFAEVNLDYVAQRALERARQPDPAFIPRRPDQRAPQVGDLICASRAGSGTRPSLSVCPLDVATFHSPGRNE